MTEKLREANELRLTRGDFYERLRGPVNFSKQTAQFTRDSIDEISRRPTVALAPAGELSPIRGDVKRHAPLARIFRQTISSSSTSSIENYQTTAAIVSPLSALSAHFLAYIYHTLAYVYATRRAAALYGASAVRCLALHCVAAPDPL